MIKEDCNVESITDQANEVFGKAVKLVQSNGHPFEDNDYTNGLTFWKSPARKVYAIESSQVNSTTTTTEVIGNTSGICFNLQLM